MGKGLLTFGAVQRAVKNLSGNMQIKVMLEPTADRKGLLLSFRTHNAVAVQGIKGSDLALSIDVFETRFLDPAIKELLSLSTEV